MSICFWVENFDAPPPLWFRTKSFRKDITGSFKKLVVIKEKENWTYNPRIATLGHEGREFLKNYARSNTCIFSAVQL